MASWSTTSSRFNIRATAPGQIVFRRAQAARRYYQVHLRLPEGFHQPLQVITDRSLPMDIDSSAASSCARNTAFVFKFTEQQLGPNKINSPRMIPPQM